MFRLTREVRFCLNAEADDQLHHRPTNSFGGFPSMTGLGRFYMLRVTLGGELNPQTSYLRNIKEVDQIVRQRIISRLEKYAGSAESLVRECYSALFNAWPGTTLDRLELALTSTLSISLTAREFPMVRLSQKFEFSASHRLHSEQLSDEENARCFGKCNNPRGHGHNYELQVTLVSKDVQASLLQCLPDFERIVSQHVIEKLDHRNLNAEIDEFSRVIPTVENIARVIFGWLKPQFAQAKAQLASVTVWETPKTWCEYSE